jgi:hypothetical protein
VSDRTAFTGKSGAKGHNFTIDTDGSVSTVSPLRRGEELTVAFAWNKGAVVQPPASGDTRERLARSNHIMLVVFLASLVVMYYFGAWYMIGRDPKPVRVIPLYRPPRDVAPGFARFIRDMKFTRDCLAADIIQLAVLGFVSFSNAAGILTITPTSKVTGEGGPKKLDELSEPLRLLVTDLASGFGKNGVSVTEGYGIVFDRAEKTLKNLYETMGGDYFHRNKHYNIIGMLFFLPFIFLAPWTWPRLLAGLRPGLMATGIFSVKVSVRLAALSKKMLKPLYAI